MPDTPLSSAFRVTDGRAAAAFSDPLRRRLILLLARREQSAGELASVTGVELKRLHYHLTALEKLGLLVVAGLRARGGRPVKLYRAVAGTFFVPAAAMAAPPSDALAAELRAAQMKLASASREGVLYQSSAQGEMLIRPVEGERAGRSAAADCWRVLHLSPAEAHRLAADLDACLEAAVKRSRGATRVYLAHFAFAPRLPN